MSIKKDVINSLKNLPDDATAEDIEYHVYVVLTLERRLENKDRAVTADEARERMKHWLD